MKRMIMKLLNDLNALTLRLRYVIDYRIIISTCAERILTNKLKPVILRNYSKSSSRDDRSRDSCRCVGLAPILSNEINYSSQQI